MVGVKGIKVVLMGVKNWTGVVLVGVKGIKVVLMGVKNCTGVVFVGVNWISKCVAGVVLLGVGASVVQVLLRNKD